MTSRTLPSMAFRKEVFPLMVTALAAAQHPAAKVDSNAVKIGGARKPTQKLQAVLEFQESLEHVLWDAILTMRNPIETTAEASKSSSPVPSRLTFAELKEKLECWRSSVLDAKSSSKETDLTESIFVQLSSALLLYVSSFRHQHPEQDKKTIPQGVSTVAKVIPVAIFSLRRRCSWPDDTPSVELAENRKFLRDIFTQLWFHFLLIFLQQLMSFLSPLENEAWSQFCQACAAEGHQPSLISSSFSDEEDEEVESEELERWRQALEKAELPPSRTATTGAGKESKPPGPPPPIWVDERAARAFHDEGVTAWSKVPPRFFSEFLLKARSVRVSIISKSFTPHQLLQSPDATCMGMELLESFMYEWNRVLQRVPLGSLSPEKRETFFPLFEQRRSAAWKTMLSEVPHGIVYRSDELSQDATEALKELSQLPLIYGKRLAKLVGDARLNAYLLVSMLVAFLTSHYVLHPHGKSRSGTTGSLHHFTAPPKQATLADLVHLREQTVMWMGVSLSCPYRPLERPCDEVEWCWRHYCPLGLLLQSCPSDNTKGITPFSANCPFPVQEFLKTHLFHVVNAKLHIGTSPTAQADGRQKVVLMCLLCGLTDIPTALILYHCSYKVLTPQLPPESNGRTTPSASRSQKLMMPTAALGGLTQAVNSAARAAETQFIAEVSAPPLSSSASNAWEQRNSDSHHSSSYRGGRDRHFRDPIPLSPPSAKPSMTDLSEAFTLDEETVRDVGAEKWTLVDGQLPGKRFHEMLYPTPLPAPEEWLLDVPALLSPNSLPPLDQTKQLQEALMTHSPVLFVLDLFLSRNVELAAQAVYYLHHRLASAATLCTPALPSSSESSENTSRGAPPPWKDAVPSILSASELPPAANVFLTPRRLLPGFVNLQTALLVIVEEWLLRWEKEELKWTCHPSEWSAKNPHPIALQMYMAAQWWNSHAHEQIHVLYQMLPLLAEAGSCMATQSFLLLLLERLERLSAGVWQLLKLQRRAISDPVELAARQKLRWRKSVTPEEMVRLVFGLAESVLVKVVMPSVRVMTASPAVYEHINRIFMVWEEATVLGGVLYGERGVEFLHIDEWRREEDLYNTSLIGENMGKIPDNVREREAFMKTLRNRTTHHPHDLLLCKEQQALFQQGLKRINLMNATLYHWQLLQVFYAQPMFTAEKLLQQAVGYRNDFLTVHLRLLSGVPAAVLMLLLHRGLELLQQYSVTESGVGSDLQRTSNAARFLAAVARSQQVDARPYLRILLRSVEHALRRYSRSSHVYAMELLKAIAQECLGSGLSHEEQYTPTQRMGLTAPPVTQYYSSGRAESFRRNRWENAAPYAPLNLYRARLVLESVLHEPCPVPLAAGGEEETAPDAGVVDMFDMEEMELRDVRWIGDQIPQEREAVKSERKENERSSNDAAPIRNLTAAENIRRQPCSSQLSLGSQLLLHLCRRQSGLYRLQADLEGKQEDLLMANAKDYDTVTDFIFLIEAIMRKPVDWSSPIVLESSLLEQKQEAGLTTPPHSCVPESFPPDALLTESGVPHVTDRLKASTLSQRSLAAVPPLISLEAAPSTDLVAREPADLALDVVQDQLSYFTANHLSYQEEPYQEALHEVEAQLRYELKEQRQKSSLAQPSLETLVSGSVHTCSKGNKNPPVVFDFTPFPLLKQNEMYLRWCRERILMEQTQHQRIYEKSERARKHLCNLLKTVLTQIADPVLFATEVLAPRMLVSMEEEIFVEKLLQFLWTQTQLRSIETEAEQEEMRRFRSAVLTVIFSLVTHFISFFIGFTSTECRRIGYFIAAVHQLLRTESAPHGNAPSFSELTVQVEALLKHSAADDSSSIAKDARSRSSAIGSPKRSVEGVSMTELETQVQSSLLFWHTREAETGLLPTSTSSVGTFAQWNVWKKSTGTATGGEASQTSAGTTSASSAASCSGSAGQWYPLSLYPLQFQVYLSDAVYHLLTSANALAVTKRNTLLLLERLPLDQFPTTIACIECILRALRPHMMKDSPNSASATAAVKRLLQNLKSRKERRTGVGRALLEQQLFQRPLQSTQKGTTEALSPASLQLWYTTELHLEKYARELLLRSVGGTAEDDSVAVAALADEDAQESSGDDEDEKEVRRTKRDRSRSPCTRSQRSEGSRTPSHIRSSSETVSSNEEGSEGESESSGDDEEGGSSRGSRVEDDEEEHSSEDRSDSADAVSSVGSEPERDEPEAEHGRDVRGGKRARVPERTSAVMKSTSESEEEQPTKKPKKE